MASTLGHNDKDAPVFTPASTQCAAPSAPSFYEVDDGMADANILYAVQAEVVPTPTPAPLFPPQAPSAAPTSLYPQYEQPTHGVAPPPQQQQQQQLQQQIKSEWAISFCSCYLTHGHCFMSWCIPCVSAGYTANGIGLSGLVVGLVFCILYVGIGVLAFGPKSNGAKWFSYDNSRTDEDEKALTAWELATSVCGIVYSLATATLRHAVRRFDGIPGSAATDVCLSFWCSWCVLSQLSAHTELVNPQRAANAATLPAYHAT